MADARSYPRDFFLYLLATATLYACVISGMILLFQYVNYLMPDALGFYREGILDSIRWSTAMIIILYPVFAIVTRFLHRDLAAHPEKGDYKIRKWLLYLTVFLAALVVIGDLITLIYQFLNGDLTGRFLIKVAIVLVIAGVVFGYELWDVRRETFEASAKVRAMEWGASLAVFLILAAGFLLIGSPSYQRQIRIDDQRVNDLQNIQYQVVEYWIPKGELPSSLSDLDNPLTGFSVPVDPETMQSYEYRATGDLTFELCATFTTELESGTPVRPTEPYMPIGSEHWDHGAERTCFTRTIDPELYKDRKPFERIFEPVPVPVL